MARQIWCAPTICGCIWTLAARTSRSNSWSGGGYACVIDHHRSHKVGVLTANWSVLFGSPFTLINVVLLDIRFSPSNTLGVRIKLRAPLIMPRISADSEKCRLHPPAVAPPHVTQLVRFAIIYTEWNGIAFSLKMARFHLLWFRFLLPVYTEEHAIRFSHSSSKPKPHQPHILGCV